MIKWISQNWRTVLWSLVLSLSVWIAAVTAADPDEQRVFNHAVQVEVVGQDPNLVIVGDIPASVQVTLRAPRSVWSQLDAEEAPVRAVVDLSGLSAGAHTVSIQIQVTERPVRIVTSTPSSIEVMLEQLETRTLPINITLNGQPAVGYEAGQAVISPENVMISGAKSLVEQVSRARVVVNLNGTRESVNQTLDVQVLDDNNQALKGLGITPSAALVTLPVSQQGGYRDVAVKVVVRGQVANGYLLTKLQVFPPIVTVYSNNPSLVNNLPGVVETQPLELRGASEDISTRLNLILPEGVSVVGEQNVQVQVGIDPIQSNLTLSKIKVVVIGLADGMSIQISPPEVDVILSGPAPLLDSLLLQDIRVVVDVTGLGPGTYQLTPKVEILVSDVVVESILPNTLEVVISTAPPGTPTP
jgi:YbbR domain-containing protein